MAASNSNSVLNRKKMKRIYLKFRRLREKLEQLPPLLSPLPKNRCSKQWRDENHVAECHRKFQELTKDLCELPPLLSPLSSDDELDVEISNEIDDVNEYYVKRLKEKELRLRVKKEEEYRKQKTRDDALNAYKDLCSLDPVQSFINRLQPVVLPVSTVETAKCTTSEIDVIPTRRRSSKNSQKQVNEEYSQEFIPKNSLKYLPLVVCGKKTTPQIQRPKRKLTVAVSEQVVCGDVSSNYTESSHMSSSNINPLSAASSIQSYISPSSNISSTSGTSCSSSSVISGNSQCTVYRLRRRFQRAQERGKYYQKRFPGYKKGGKDELLPIGLYPEKVAGHIQVKVMEWNNTVDRPPTPPTPVDFAENVPTPPPSPVPKFDCEDNSSNNLLDFDCFDGLFASHDERNTKPDAFELELNRHIEQFASGQHDLSTDLSFLDLDGL